MIAAIMVKEEFLEDFRREVRTEASESIREEGCFRFDVLEDAEEPRLFFLYEIFKDAAALEEHREAPHNVRWLEISKTWRDESRKTRNLCSLIHSHEWQGGDK